jgi:hypothetical protein
MRSNKVWFWAGLLCLALSVPGGTARANDEDDCEPVQGDFSSTLLPPDDCDSPVGICTLGLLTGNLKATYHFTMLTLGPDPDDPTELVYTGVSVITTRDGSQLFSMDTGVMYPNPAGLTPFVTTAHLVGGTGRFRDVTGGQIVAPALLDFATGEAVGTYTGEICR